MKLVRKLMQEELGDTYNTMTISNASPLQHGYVVEKNRFVVVGGRSDQVDDNQLRRNFTELIENPVPVTHNCWTFLGLDEMPNEIAIMVRQLPSPAAACKIYGSGCKCGVDPMVLCEQHPCLCPQCKHGKVLSCSWRVKAKKYLAAHRWQWLPPADGCVTYIQALEMIGQEVPKSPPRA